MSKQYIFYSDALHGWLAVPIVDIVTLGIEKQISSYSFTRGDTAYLEEDADATLFTGHALKMGHAFIVSDVDEGNVSEIRSYKRWSQSQTYSKYNGGLRANV